MIEKFDFPDENRHIEYKECSKNELPKSIWETISSFANTDGGIIFLGVKECKKTHENIPVGVKDADKLKTDFLNLQGNVNKISKKVVSEENIEVFCVKNKQVVAINVPKINFSDRPVYLNGNIQNAYVRENDSDRKVNKEELRFFLREADTILDSELLDNYGLDDLNLIDVTNYQVALQEVSGDLYNAESPEKFLISMGLLEKDRSKYNGDYKLTKAALLLFGKYNSIVSVFPNFMLDFITKDNKTTVDYSDRVLTSNEPGYPNNIYSFFNVVWQKLSAIIKNGFHLKENKRIDMGEAFKRVIREALVNTLIHADYSSNRPVKVVAYNDYIEFDNPGDLRISSEKFIEGGLSLPRNPKIFSIFIKAKLGERTGSGGPRIYKTTKDLQLRTPEIRSNLDHTILTIWNVPLTEQVLKELPEKWRSTYKYMSEHLIASYGELKNLYKNSYEGHKILNEMVTDGYLEKTGTRKGTRYTISRDSPAAKVSMNSYMREIQRIFEYK